LTGRERNLLKRDYRSLSRATQAEWKKAAAKCNEFRTYDLALDDSTPTALSVTVQRFRYDTKVLGFGRNPQSETLILPL
jgi:hypothetical protein